MARGAPPEVVPDVYERRLLYVFEQGKGAEGFGGYISEDTWLEGEYPDTELVVVITFKDRPGCRYIFRSTIWRPSSNSNPEAQAYDIDISLTEWTGTLRSIPWTSGMAYEPRPARSGATRRRPNLG